MSIKYVFFSLEKGAHWFKCTLFWYGPGQQFARYGPNLPIKYIKRFLKRDFRSFFARLRAEA